MKNILKKALFSCAILSIATSNASAVFTVEKMGADNPGVAGRVRAHAKKFATHASEAQMRELMLTSGWTAGIAPEVAQLAELQRTLEATQKDHAGTLSHMQNRHKADLAEKEAEHDGLKVALADKEAERVHWHSEFNRVSGAGVGKQLKDAQDEVARLTADLTAAHDDSDATSIAGKLKAAEAEVLRLTADLTKAHDATDASSIAGKLKIAQDEVQRLTADLTAAHDDSDATSIAGKLKAAEAEVARLTADLTAAHDDSDATSVAGKLKAAQDEVTRLTADLTKAHDDSDASSIAGKLKIAQDEVQRLDGELTDAVKALGGDLTVPDANGDPWNSAAADLKEQVDQLTTANDKLAAQLTSAGDAPKALNDLGVTDTNGDPLNKLAAQLNDQLKTSKGEVGKLAAELTTAQQDLAAAEDEVHDLTGELQKAKDDMAELITALKSFNPSISYKGFRGNKAKQQASQKGFQALLAKYTS